MVAKTSGKTLFVGIQELITLKGAAEKEGRRVKEKDLSILNDGAFLVENGLLQWVGRRDEASSVVNSEVEQVDLQAQTVLPAFIECHTHSIFGGDRFDEFELRLTGVSYEEISRRGGGIRSTVKNTRESSDEILVKDLKSRVEEFRRQGVSSVEVKTGYGLSTKEELRLLKLVKSINDPRVITTFLGPHSTSPEFNQLDEYLEDLITKALPEVAQRNLASRVDIFIESGFFTPKQAEKYFEAAKRLGFDISVHAEQLSWSGGIQKAVEFGAKSVDHCVNASDEDTNILSESQTTSVLLPSADFYLDIGYPPARKLIDEGVRVALSTDFNPGSSPSQSIELCSLLARLKMKMSLPEVFSAWTVGAAHVLGLEKQQGSLEVNKLADFTVWNKSWRSFFYNFQEIHPRDLYLSGKRVAFS